MGRKTDYEVHMCQQAYELCQGGATDFEVAEALDCHLATLYRWKAKHPEFAQAMKLGKDAPDDRVEASYYHRSVGYNYHALKIMQHEGKVVLHEYIEHVPPDTGAAFNWMVNRRGWRNRQTLEHVGKDDGPIQVTAVDELSDDDLEAIARGGSPTPPEPETGKN